MGEVADMMLDGTLCAGCGLSLGGEAYGIPRVCSKQCAKDQGGVDMAKDGSIIYEDKKKK